MPDLLPSQIEISSSGHILNDSWTLAGGYFATNYPSHGVTVFFAATESSISRGSVISVLYPGHHSQRYVEGKGVTFSLVLA